VQTRFTIDFGSRWASIASKLATLRTMGLQHRPRILASEAFQMKRYYTATVFLLLCSCSLQAAEKPKFDGYWWSSMTQSFKLGWVQGWAQAMDSAFSAAMGTCLGNIPMYQKQFPNTDRKELVQKFCLENSSYDFDGIAMGQFADGIDTFYKDFRNKQIEIEWAIQYVRDEVKGKSAQELETEITLWRKCTAAMQTGNNDEAVKACSPDTGTTR